MAENSVRITRMDNGALLEWWFHRESPMGPPTEMRVYDFAVDGAAGALRSRVQAVLTDQVVPPQTTNRYRISLMRGQNGLAVRRNREAPMLFRLPEDQDAMEAYVAGLL